MKGSSLRDPVMHEWLGKVDDIQFAESSKAVGAVLRVRFAACRAGAHPKTEHGPPCNEVFWGGRSCCPRYGGSALLVLGMI